MQLDDFEGLTDSENVPYLRVIRSYEYSRNNPSHQKDYMDFISNYSSDAICVSTAKFGFGNESRSVADFDRRYFLLPESMYSSLFRDIDGIDFFPWNWSNCSSYVKNVFSNFLTLRKRKNFLCIGAGSGYVNFLAADIMEKGGVNHGLEMAENLFRECQMRARDIEWNLPALRTRITFPSFFKDPCRLFNARVRYDSIFCNRYVTFEDAWWMASFLSDGGVMMCPYVENGEEGVASMLFSKATTLSVQRIKADLKFLLREKKSDLVLLDVRGAMSADDLSALCLQIISESLWRKFRQENPSDVKNQCTDIRLDWKWKFYMRYKTWFDELLSKTKQSITLMYTFLLRVTESEANECLKTTKSLTELIDNITDRIEDFKGFAVGKVPRRQSIPYWLTPASFFWRLNSLGGVLSSSLKYLQAAAIKKPDIWFRLKIELDRLMTDEEETSYDIFDMKLPHPESRSLQVCWGLRRAVCLNLYKVLRRYFEFVEIHRSNVSTASPRDDVDYLLDFQEILSQLTSGVGNLLDDDYLTRLVSPSSCGWNDVFEYVFPPTNRINDPLSKVQLWNDCFQSAIQISLDDTLRSEMELMTFAFERLRWLKRGLSWYIIRRHRFYDENAVLFNAEDIIRTSELFIHPDNDRVKLSLNIPMLILSCLRQISSLLSGGSDVKKSVRHRYYDFLDKNAPQLLFPTALRKIVLSKLREM